MNSGNDEPASPPSEGDSQSQFRLFPIVVSLHLKKRPIGETLASKSGVFVLTGPIRFQSFVVAGVSYTECTYFV